MKKIVLLSSMKFRTEIDIAPFARGLEYGEGVLSLGSCFAESISRRLAEAKFSLTINPTGILFNPMSILSALQSFVQGRRVAQGEILEGNGVWYNHNFHSSFSCPTFDEAVAKMERGYALGEGALRESKHLILTFGTAFVFEKDGAIVANCHREATSAFVRRRLSVDEIVEGYSRLIEEHLKDKHIVLTVSPIRHLADGLDGNSVSKAILRLAAEQLCERFDCVHYFPSFEIVCDDLRDYRFYGEDLVHPSQQCVEYIWQKFKGASIGARSQKLLPTIEKVLLAAKHRPRNPQSEEHKGLCRATLATIQSIKGVDFSDEIEYFNRSLQ